MHVEIIGMEGHTKGSIALYNKDKRLILVSDATCPFVWMFLEESTTVSEYIKMLEEVLNSAVKKVQEKYKSKGENNKRRQISLSP